MCAVKYPKGIFDNTPAASTKFIIHNAEKNDVTFKKTNFVVNKTEYNMGSKKDKVIEELYKICKRKNNYVFHNDLVKDVCKKVGFGNPFDVTKLDNKTKLPEILINNNIAIIHLGSGKHKFIKGIEKVYHDFEPIQETLDWKYQKSLLNQYNSSESNILSVVNSSHKCNFLMVQI